MVKIKIGKYCVYHHIGKGEVFYVGAGSYSRPFEINKRPISWKQFVRDELENSYEIHIVRYFDTLALALDFEKQEIGKIKPYLNLIGIANQSCPRKKGESSKNHKPNKELLQTVRVLKEKGFSLVDIAGVLNV